MGVVRDILTMSNDNLTNAPRVLIRNGPGGTGDSYSTHDLIDKLSRDSWNTPESRRAVLQLA